MDFSLNEEQTALVDLADQILTEKATHESIRAIERAEGPRFDADLWKTLGTSGLIGVALPEAYGGAGMGFLEFSAILEKVGKTVAPVPLLETVVLGGMPLAAHGTEEQKKNTFARDCLGRADRHRRSSRGFAGTGGSWHHSGGGRKWMGSRRPQDCGARCGTRQPDSGAGENRERDHDLSRGSHS
jgi:hypothetical protein